MWRDIKNEARLIYKNLLPYFCVSAVISYLVYDAGRSFLVNGTYLNTKIVVKGILSADLEWVRRSVLNSSIILVLFSMFIIYNHLSAHEKVKGFSYIIPCNSKRLIFVRLCNLIFSIWLFGTLGSIIGNIFLQIKYPTLQIQFLQIFGYSLVEGLLKLAPHIALYVLIFYFVSSLVEEKKFILYYTFCISSWLLLVVFVDYIVKFYTPLTIRDALTNPINILKICSFLIISGAFTYLAAIIYDYLRIGKKFGLHVKCHTYSQGRLHTLAHYEYKIAYNYRVFSILLVPLALVMFVSIAALSRVGNLKSFYPVVLAVSELIFPITIIPVIKSITAVEREVNIEDMIQIIPEAKRRQFHYRSVIFLVVCLFTIVFYTALIMLLFQLDSFQLQSVILATIPNLLLIVSINLFFIASLKKENIGIVFSIGVWFMLYSLRKVIPSMLNPFGILAYSPFSLKIVPGKISIVVISCIILTYVLLKEKVFARKV